MTTLFPSFGNTKYVVNHMADDICIDEKIVAITDAGGIVTGTWTAFNATIDGLTYNVAAGTKDFNTGDVASPTTYYLYFKLVAGVPAATVSTTNPCIDATLTTGFFITNVLRFKSVTGTVTYYISKYPTQNGVEDLAHNLKEDSLFFEPMWVGGIAPTFTAGTGKLSTSSGYVRFPGNEPRAQAAITNGTFLKDDESSILADLTTLTTYANGDTISDTKWVKLLVGVMRNKGGILDCDYMVMRQSKPGTEYADAATAKADAENKAQSGFGYTYIAACTPICFITAKMDTGALTFPAGYEVIDIRATGTTRGSGGGASVISHSALSNLNVVADHPGYVTLDGARALTGDWDAGANDIKAETFTSDVATGTAPFTIASETVVPNLNVDQVDGKDSTDFVLCSGAQPLTGNWDAGSFKITAETLASDVATGTAPLTVASTTVVTNLNADSVDGIAGTDLVKRDGTTALTGAWDVGSFQVRAETFQSDVATGTAPLTVASTTVVANLNAATVNGHADTAFLHADGSVNASGALNMGSQSITAANAIGCATITASGAAKALTIESTQATGTAPLTVASTTKVANLNAEQVDGKDSTDFALLDGTQALTANWDVGSYQIRAETFRSDVATGTAPLTVASATKVTNLNADLLDDLSSAAFLQADGSIALNGNLTVNGTYTLDGVDLSAHATNASAHHAPITISDDINNALLALNTQQLDLDTQTASYAFMGPAYGASAAKPTFRQITADDVQRPSTTLTAADGTNNNLALTSGYRLFILSGPTSNFTITGFSGGRDGMIVYIYNSTAKTMTLSNESVSSTASNRIINNAGTIGAGTMVSLAYFGGTLNRWVILSRGN